MSLVICDNIGCTVDHRDQIELNYFMIVQALNDAAGDFRHRIIKNLLPSQDGMMFVSRNIRMPETFKEGFYECNKVCEKEQKKKIEDNILLKKFREKNSKEFWKEVSNRKGIIKCLQNRLY